MLLIDVGNSRVKWARVQGCEWLNTGGADITEWPVFHQAIATLPQSNKILVSNVAGDESARQVREACAGWRCPVEFVRPRIEQCGVRNTYEHAAQLGSDRWAALIAAWHHERKACLVVSCGTATTIDALSDEGEFLGGLILPGIVLMHRSLAAGTAQLSIGRGKWQAFPRNTADSITSGAIQATAGAIIRQYELLGVPGARCLISGGDADSVGNHLAMPLARMHNLVLQGLQIIGQEGLQRGS